MIRIEFSEADIKALEYERYHYPHPMVQRKMEALWLKSQGLPHNEICRLTGITKYTLCSYLKAYKAGGIAKLKELNLYRPKSELEKYTSTIEEYFREHPPASIKEAMSKIEELTGIKRSETQIGKFLKSIGMKPRKVGMVPAKADIEEQETFKKKTWNPDLKKRNLVKERFFS